MTTYASTVLSLGANGREVTNIQRALNNRSANINLTEDGYFGSATLAAVKYVQCVAGLTVDGSVGTRTRAFINRGENGLPTLSVGSRGSEVAAVQQTLAQAYSANIVADGFFGEQTKQAVATFQRNNHLVGDGVVGPRTWSFIVASRFRSPVCKLWLAPETQISPYGLGSVSVDMTYGEVKQALGEGYTYTVQSRFLVGSSAILVKKNSNSLSFYIVYDEGETLRDDSQFNLLVIEDARYKTAEGVGPHTLIRSAVEVYGEATLSISPVESRESVTFARSPEGGLMWFRTGEFENAGIYEGARSGFRQTTKFDPNATIWQIWLSSTRR